MPYAYGVGADTDDLSACLTQKDPQEVKGHLKANVDKIFKNAPSGCTQISLGGSTPKNDARHAILSETTGLTREQIHAMIDGIHPRYLETSGDFTKPISENIRWLQTSNGYHTQDSFTNRLMTNIISYHENLGGSSEGKILASLLLTPKIPYSHILRFDDREKGLVLEDHGFRPEKVADGIRLITQAVGYVQTVSGIAANSKRQSIAISEMRREYGIMDEQSHTFWNETQMARVDPDEFIKPGSFERIKPEGFLAARQEVVERWDEWNDDERQVLNDWFTRGANESSNSAMDMIRAIDGVSTEFGKWKERNHVFNGMFKAMEKVDVKSPDFPAQLDELCTQSGRIFTHEKDIGIWGAGAQMLGLFNICHCMIDENPTQFTPVTEETSKHRVNMEEGEKTRIYHMENLKYQRGLPAFTERLKRLHTSNPDLVEVLWDSVKLRMPDPRIVPEWPCRLMVAGDYIGKGKEGPTLEYPDRFMGVLEANAGKPYIVEYARGALEGGVPENYPLFEGFLSPDYTRHLDRMDENIARAMTLAIGREDARKYLTPATPEGREVLACAMLHPEGLKGFYPVPNQTFPDDGQMQTLKDASDLRLSRVVGRIERKPYQTEFINTYCQSDNAFRDVLAEGEILPRAERMESQAKGSASTLLIMLNVPQDRQTLLSPAVCTILDDDPAAIGPIRTIQESGRLNDISPHLTNQDNVSFFDRQRLNILASRAEDDQQWTVVKRALTHLD